MRSLFSLSAKLTSGVLACWLGASLLPAAEPVRLTYWNWAPHIEKVVDIWNRKNPDVQVRISRAAGALEIVPKLLAADRAGNPPDVTNVTYQDLPALIVNGLVANLTPEMAPLQTNTSPVAWNLVNFGGVTWAAPQGTSPMMFYYREDLFQEYGLEVPKTWAEFARVAKKLRQIQPQRFLTTFPTAEPGLFAALTHQLGSSWWKLEGDDWTISIANRSGRRVAEFWQDLVASDAVATSQHWSPEWSSAIAEGRMLGFISAVWAPPLLANIAPATKGKWNVAPLPRWGEADGTSYAGGVMGGSATAVSAKTRHPAEAKRFALWITSDPEALEAYIRLVAIWPANLSARHSPALANAPAFIPQKTDFYPMATAIDLDTPKISWGPNVSTTFDAFRNAFAKAVRRKSGFVEALETVQRTAVRDMRSQGYIVHEGN